MSARPKLDNLVKVRTAWGQDAPEWIIALAEACNAETQAAVAKRLGYSPATINQVLANGYQAGDMVRLEAVARGVLMAETVLCPVMKDDIGRDVCLGWQKRPFSTASANAVRMYQGCRSGCPHSRLSPTERKGANDAQ